MIQEFELWTEYPTMIGEFELNSLRWLVSLNWMLHYNRWAWTEYSMIIGEFEMNYFDDWWVLTE